MAFPQTPLEVKVELQLASVWTDVTAYTYTRDPIQIARGRADEASGASPSTCGLTFNNRDGRFSPRNPTGPYYGALGRNTPTRVSVALGATRLVSPVALDAMSTPDSANLSIVGDIDLRADARMDAWYHVPGWTLLSKSQVAGQRSYRFGISGSAIFLAWSADGTTEIFVESTVPLPRTVGRQAIRVTLDVDNGAAGKTATFYYSDTISGTWIQLGAAVTTAGTTSIFNGTGVLAAGSASSAAGAVEVYAAEVRQGIAGTVHANPIFTAQASGATSFADGSGNTWTIVAGASLTNRRYRFHGEASNWPSKWDLSGKDVWVSVTAAGVLRRLGQGTSANIAAIRRGILASATPAMAYWPLEDAAGSTSMASGLPAGAVMAIAGAPRLAASDAFPPSNPLPEMALGSFSGAVGYTSTNIINTQWLVLVPAGEPSGTIARVYTTGTAARWDVNYVTGGGGALLLAAYDVAGAALLSAPLAFTVNDVPSAIALQLVQNGANIDWALSVQSYTPGAGSYGPPGTGTLAGRTVGAANYVQINPDRLLTGTVVGHVVVNAAIPDGAAALAILRGSAGERAGRRIERICSEQLIAFSARGDLDVTTAMGAQLPSPLPALLAESPAADLGMLLEPRDAFGLGYRTRSSIYNQGVGLALVYGDLRDLTPVEDDQQTRNDITVTRIGGSSARQELATGALSTQAPPNGVGRYDESDSINAFLDTDLPDQAMWRLRQGTVDEARYPVISVLLESTPFASSSALTTSALDLDVGDLITISNPPAWLPPDQIRQIVQGTTETLEQFGYSIEVNCTPASPWSVGLYDDPIAPAARYAADGATLSAGITSTATGAAALSIVTPAGMPLWTSAGADFPLDIVMGGERITLSAIAATASPQAATVSARSVNGVVKAHLAGAALQIADVAYYAL